MSGRMCFYPKQSVAVARDMSRKERMVGDAGGRPSGQSSLPGHPSAKFSARNEGHGESGEDNYSDRHLASENASFANLDLRSAPKRAALRASQGLRASRGQRRLHAVWA